MTFDGLTLAAMAAELCEQLLGARVQKVVQPDLLTIALELYASHTRSWLLLSAEPQRPRVYLTAEKPGRGVETPTPLLLLLRKHIDGLRLGEIIQPSGERILSFGFSGRPFSDGDSTEPPGNTFRLIIEAISQYSNLILVDATDTVLDAARRISAEQNRTRVTLPHRPYVPPPAQSKRSLGLVDLAACQTALLEAGTGANLWQALVAGFAGLGPLAAREVVFRSTGDAKSRVPTDLRALDDVAARLVAVLAEITQPVFEGTFTASVARTDEAITAFAPYALTHLGRWEAMPSLSAAADAFYRQGPRLGSVEIARRALREAIAKTRSPVERKRESLLRALEGTARADSFRERGDLLLTYGTTIQPGLTHCQLDGVEIELDPRLSAIDNAQGYFRRYQKAKAALREVPVLLEETELRLRYLDEVAGLAELADSVEGIRTIRAELRPERPRTGPTKKRRPARRPESGVLRLKASDGSEILVGRSAQQNHLVTFELARPDDVWLHARGCPGAHVVLRSESGSPSAHVLEEAARIAAGYSANRTAGKVTVDWTRRKLVRRLGKGAPGLVSYSGEQSLVVRPEILSARS